MKTIVVSGALANRPGNGGGAWVRLNWVLGLKRLGFDVHFVEEIRPEACVDENGAVTAFDQSINLSYFRRVSESYLLSSSLIYNNGEQTHGLRLGELLELAQSADLLVNISGHLTCAALLERFRCKAYVDLDPGFTQIWHESGNPGARLAGYDAYFTVGANIGKSNCPIPTCGIPWRPLRPPVVLDEWPMVHGDSNGRFTTVASWRGPFGPVQFGGKTLGLKVHEFRKFLQLPQRTRQLFELALKIHPAEEKDLESLRSHGWLLVDPSVAADPHAFRQYVQGSTAEFSAAQGVYVETNSGWFSDRTVVYLTSGKPALVQDTGFSENYPVGSGLIPFRTLEEAINGADDIANNYAKHSQAARALAERFFDSDKVLGAFMDLW